MFLRIFSAVLQPRAAAKLLFSRVNSVRVQNASHNLERNQNKGTDAELEWGGAGGIAGSVEFHQDVQINSQNKTTLR